MSMQGADTRSPPPVLLVHGGAGLIRRDLDADLECAMRNALAQALRRGHALLASGASALDAAVGAVTVLEDVPYFNAGRGAVFTHEGINELDAAVMDGATLRAGAIAGVRHVRNPVALARAVMERSPHVMLAGEGAEAFARTQGIALVEPGYLRTDARWQQLQDALQQEAGGGKVDHFGTVGAVALDVHGGLAAATSTGGMTNKRWNRIGDTPVIGAGTYANRACAVSGTGWGEFYIRT
ncbi:MAG: isoaspartyl peptidase/L-asparaginase family protein, partial [Rhodanobacteraceae bacterium]